MEGRRSIFSTKGDGEQIGYIEGAEAFNLSGQRRCRYDGQTGNLRDLGTGSIVGHVSLEGRFVGLSWRVDELFRQFDDDLDGAVRQEEASPNGVGEQLAQEPAPAEDEAPKSPHGNAMHPLRQVFAIANEVFGQRAIEDDQGFRNVGETPNPPSDGTEPPVRTDSAGERSGPFPEEAERIFEMLRNRIGLSAQVRDVDEMPIPTPEQTDAAVTTTIPARPSGPFSQEVERVFEMLRDKELD